MRLSSPIPLLLAAAAMSGGALKGLNSLLCGSIKGGPFSVEGASDGVAALVSKTGARIRNQVVSSGHCGCEHTETLRQPGVLSQVEAVQQA